MQVLKTLTLALAVALVGTACGDDDGKGGNENLDGGGVKTDGGGPDAGGGGLVLDGAVLPCNAGTDPKGDKCGGSHCIQTEAELRASAVAGATCGGEVEVKSFCKLDAVKHVGECTTTAFAGEGLDPASNASAFKASVKTCAAAKEQATFSGTCLDCFVESGHCAAVKCLNDCLGDSNSNKCTICRIEQGCISSFYSCAGIANPLDMLPR